AASRGSCPRRTSACQFRSFAPDAGSRLVLGRFDAAKTFDAIAGRPHPRSRMTKCDVAVDRRRRASAFGFVLALCGASACGVLDHGARGDGGSGPSTADAGDGTGAGDDTADPG